MTPVAAVRKRRKFDLKTFLSTIDDGRTIATLPTKRMIFVQGDLADAVFYIQEGKVPSADLLTLFVFDSPTLRPCEKRRAVSHLRCYVLQTGSDCSKLLGI